MTRVFNFSAGPAALPTEVLEQAAAEMLDWRSTGMSVMEMSHRSPAFLEIHELALSDLRELLAVPDDYEILFMQGGAIAANALVPMNLIARRTTQSPSVSPQADYLITGAWSAKSFQEAGKYGAINLVATSETSDFTAIPELSEWRLSNDAAYLHLCTNETIHGIEFHTLPQLDKQAVVVADMSSHLLSRPLTINQFGVIYGGAQKNIGAAGLTLVIVRRDLLGHALPCTPSAFNWQTVAAHQSMYNTPPTYAIYIAGLVFQWLKRQGGLSVIEQRNIAKAELLYRTIDQSQLYRNQIATAVRSRMNIPFFLTDPSLEQAFLDGAKTRGLVNLKGHKSVGGMRASIYNAMPFEGVQALANYMAEFERSSA